MPCKAIGYPSHLLEPVQNTGYIVGKGDHTTAPPFSRSTPPPFSKIPRFLEIQDVPNFHRSLRKTKVLKNSCNQFLYHIYPQSILVLEDEERMEKLL